MPGFDGTGPLGEGPMTGQGKGYCMLKTDNESPDIVEGYIGLQGTPYISDRVTDRAFPYHPAYSVPGYIHAVTDNRFRMPNYPVHGRGRRFFGRRRGRRRGFRMMASNNYPLHRF